MISFATLSMLMAGASATTCQNIAGNYYCDETNLVQFQNVGFSGSYNRVTSFNSDGTCSSTPQVFSGPLSPFDEELSVHFRGPIQLDNFKVFTSSGSSSAKKRALHHRHADPEPEPVVVTATNYYTAFVTVDANGNQATVSGTVGASVSTNDISTSQTPVSTSSTSSEIDGTKPQSEYTASSSAFQKPTTNVGTSSHTSAGGVYNYNFNHQDESSATGSSIITTTSSSWSAQTPVATQTGGSSDWSLVSNYNAAAGSSDGCVFLNNLGGSGSGVFDFLHGNSLSYAGSDGISCASSPETLSRTVVPSNKEFIIFSDKPCQGDDCGYYRPGTVAYHGFGGAHKVFVFEFSMPTDNTGGFNADMPAIWLLNAQIPRTLQYGTSSCSCWSSGCGELDLWEVLNSGNNRLTTTLHDKQGGSGGGTADYFQRPTQGTLKGAVIFDGTTITVVEIPEIPDSIDDGTIQGWIQQSGQASTVNL